MQLNNLEKSIKKLKEASPKRNFKQSIDLIINLKEINLKKAEEQVDFFAPLHYSKGKKVKVCAFSGPELKDESQKNCDMTITQEEFIRYARDKKLTRKLAKSYDFFIAQANIMPQVAQTFGKVLGVRGKMPNPKAGCVVPPKANLAPLVEKLRQTIRIVAKIQPLVQLSVGVEDMPDAHIADNVSSLFDQLIHHLPNEKNNIHSIFLKTTMGLSFEIDFNGSIIEKTDCKGTVAEEKKKTKSKGIANAVPVTPAVSAMIKEDAKDAVGIASEAKSEPKTAKALKAPKLSKAGKDD